MGYKEGIRGYYLVKIIVFSVSLNIVDLFAFLCSSYTCCPPDQSLVKSLESSTSQERFFFFFKLSNMFEISEKTHFCSIIYPLTYLLYTTYLIFLPEYNLTLSPSLSWLLVYSLHQISSPAPLLSRLLWILEALCLICPVCTSPHLCRRHSTQMSLATPPSVGATALAT